MTHLLLGHSDTFQGWLVDFPTMFWSGVLRFVEAIVAAAPFLLVGVFVAGVLRGMLGTQRIREIFGADHWSGPIRAWFIGILLPVCALGALPVARELRRAGVPSGTVLSFVLVAPVLNPISIAYGLSHIAMYTLVYFAVGTLIVSLAIGFVWNRLISSRADVMPESAERLPGTGLARLKVAGLTTARGLVGPDAVDWLLAVFTVGLLGAFLPFGVMQRGLTPDNVWAPVIMAGVAIPVYVTPFDVMAQFGLIVRDGYSMGAAFALIVLGAGSNVGVANWIRRDYGLRPLMIFITLLLGITLVLGYAADRTIATGEIYAEHTHAFDSFTRVYQVSWAEAGPTWLINKIARDIRPAELAGLLVVLIIGGIGALTWLGGERFSVDRIMKIEQERVRDSAWNPALPSWAVAGIFAVGTVATGVGLLYVLYPHPTEVLADAKLVRFGVIDAIRDENADEIIRRGMQWEQLVRRLPTGLLIRTGSVSEAQQEATDRLLHGLDLVHDLGEEEEYQALLALEPYLHELHRDCYRAYTE